MPPTTNAQETSPKESLLHADIRQYKTTQQATYLGLGLAVLLVVVLFTFYQTQKRYNRKLSLVNTELEQSYHAIRESAQLIGTQKNDLEKALQQLKELDTFKGKMVGMIAHDLKTPLQAIIGFTQDAHQHPHANAIHQAAQRMLLLILNMLDVQKLTQAKITLNKSCQCLPSLGKDAIAQVEWFAQAKNIRLEQAKTPAMCLPVDDSLITRALLNLLHNAIKFTPHNGHIKLSYEALPDTREIKVMVSDNGEGIAPENLSTIFQPYHQANATQASTGLGLAFCKMAIEAHQGNIGVTSTLGKGSTFWFTLPMPNPVQVNQTLEQTLVKSPASMLCLSSDDKVYLQPYLSKIKEHKIYHFTKIKSILQQIDDQNRPNLVIWKNTLKQAVISANQLQYEALLDLV
jgi:signal transduction histidine kinase